MKLNKFNLKRCNKLNSWCWCVSCFSDKLPKEIFGKIMQQHMIMHKEYYNSLGYNTYDTDVYEVSKTVKKQVMKYKYE